MKYEVDIDFSQFKNAYGGLYIALEGIDGSGKTIQVEALKKYFEGMGRAVVTTREPRKDSGLLAQLNSNILLGKVDIPPSAYQYLFTAERILHHQELIIPALKADKVVITDRCFWSAIPYGVLDYDGDDIDTVAKQLIATQGIPLMHNQVAYPNSVFYLEVDAKTGLERSVGKGHEHAEIYETEDKLKKIESGYKWLLQNFPDQFRVINGCDSIAQVTETLTDVINK